MKKIIISLVFMMAACMGAGAMSFERAQAEALYLTDKMAYELNLNDQQYNDAYEINLDYFFRIDSPSDLYGDYYSYRLGDLRCILHDWQYSLLMAADYFLRPIVWRAGGWFFPIYSYYNRNYFYYSRPTVWATYYGGHSRYHHRNGFYGNRRPIWDGGLRGHDMHRPAPNGRHYSSNTHRPTSGMGGRNGGAHRYEGNGYHIDLNGHRSDGGNHHGNMNPNGRSHHGNMNSDGGSHHGNMNPNGRSHHGNMNSSGGMHRGNSFDGSSSRMSSDSRRVSSRGSFGSGMSHNSRMSHSSGMSRGGGMSHGSGMSRGGGMSHGGGSRGGRR